jgi:PAS domain S-box-containing protein
MTDSISTEPSTSSLAPIFVSAIHASQEAVVIVDDQQRIVLFNPAAQRLFECTEAGTLGSPLSRCIPERLRQAHDAHVRDFDGPGATERPMSGRTAIRGLRANGEEFPAQAMITRVEVPGDTGPRRYFTALVHDLSRELTLKAEIDALSDRMRSVFDLAPVAIWITDGEAIVYANAVCAALFAAPDGGSLVGKSIYALLHPRSHLPVRQQMAQVWASNAPVSMVHEQIARLDGGHRDVDIAMAALPCHDRTVLQMVITDISQRTEERLALERSRLDLRRLSASLADTREAERRHIARELHDELGQRLSSLKMELSTLAKSLRRAKEDRITPMLEMVDDTVAAVRRIATDLRPMMIDDLGLSAALEWLARESARRMRVEIDLHVDEDALPPGDTASISLYRIVQEALTNVARHAHASRVRIDGRRSGDRFMLTVEDNGIGFSESSRNKEGSLGLIGIRERVLILGGDLQIDNAPSGGGRITVTLPLETPATSAAAAPSAYSEIAKLSAMPRPRRPDLQRPSIETLTHELQVHQIELEMQNEELQRAQIELAAARDRYVDLYDFAPVGYFTLDRQGQVVEANLTGAALLGKHRAALMGRSFARCVSAIDSDRWQRHLQQVFQNDATQRIELTLCTDDGGAFDAQIDSLRVIRVGTEPRLRISVIDISERRRAAIDRRLALNAVGTSEAERRRVARALHDELGQQLSTLKMDLSGMQIPNDRRRTDQRIVDMTQAIDASLATVRRITTELRPLMLDDLGLNAALDWLTREAARQSGLTVTLSVDGTDPPLDEAQSVGLFRMAQTALADVIRHASGQGAHLELKTSADGVVLVVAAQGSGWPAVPLYAQPDADAQLRDQAHLLGGELTIDAGPGVCRKVTFRLPLA